MPSRSQPVSKALLALVLVTFLAAAACYVLGNFALSMLKQKEEARLIPSHASTYSVENARLRAINAPDATATRNRVVFFGDSRVQQWSPAPELPGAELVWRGIGGETTAQMLLRFSDDVIALSPAAVVIQAGINDVVAGIVLGRGDQAARDALANLRIMTDMAARSGCRVVLISVIHPSSPSLLRRFVWSDRIHLLVDELNSGLKASSGNAVEFLDANSVLSLHNGRIGRKFALDTLHINPAGYEQINKLIEHSFDGRFHAVQ